MSTIDRIKELEGCQRELPSARNLRFAIAVAEWNSNITHELLRGAVESLRKAGAEEIKVMYVPGTFELTNAAARLKQEAYYDAIIVLGCVVRGDTPHFDYICQGVAQGISLLNTEVDHSGIKQPRISPVVFGVLTTETMAQAEERTTGALGNKGSEAAETAIRMCRPHIEILKKETE